MKKLTLVAVLLLGVGLVAGFADDQVTFTVDGSATATFGVDLDTMDMGFKNANTATFDVTMVAKQSAEKGAEMGVYGYIKLADFQFLVDEAAPVTVSAPTITAKIMAAPLWIGLYSMPSYTTVDKVALVDGTAATTTYATVGGISIGYDSTAIDLTAKISSAGDWDTPADGWALGLDASVSASPLSVAAGLAMGVGYASNPIAFGVKPSLSLAVGASSMLDPYVAFDGVIPDGGGAMTYELGAGMTFDLLNDDKFLVTLATSYSEAADLDAKFSVTEASGDSGIVAGLGASLTVLLKDLTSGSLGYTLTITGDWTTPKIKPYTKITYDDASNLFLQAGTYLYLIPNTTFQIDYSSGTNISDDIGDLEISAKIDF